MERSYESRELAKFDALFILPNTLQSIALPLHCFRLLFRAANVIRGTRARAPRFQVHSETARLRSRVKLATSRNETVESHASSEDDKITSLQQHDRRDCSKCE